jgi:hypothetical protein
MIASCGGTRSRDESRSWQEPEGQTKPREGLIPNFSEILSVASWPVFRYGNLRQVYV